MKIPERGETFKHTSGKTYFVERITINATTGEHDIVYFSTVDGAHYTRTLANFMGYNEQHQLRFVPVETC